MITARLLVGLLVAGGTGLVALLAVRRARRRLVPGWQGPVAHLADIVLLVSLLTVVANVLGALGWFAPWPMVAGVLLLAAALGRWGWSGVQHQAAHPPEADRPGLVGEERWTGIAAAVGTGAVVAAWCRDARLVASHGIYDWDSVWYHLPAAADFVQSGSFMHLRLYGADAAVATYPFGAEVFHAIGMLVTGSDILSPLLNLGWLAVYLLAARTFGTRYRCPNLAMMAALVVVVFPVMVKFEALSALSEMMGLACGTAAIAFVVTFDRRDAGRGRLVFVGLAIGLMAATKIALLGPAVTLLGGVLVIEALRERGGLRRSILPLAASSAITGAFWYGRNVWLFANPVPALPLGVGSLALPRVTIAGQTGPMLPTLVSGIVKGTVSSALTQSLGPSWMLILVAPILLLFTLRREQQTELRVLAVVAALMTIWGLLTPQYLHDGVYVNILSNIRYLLSGIGLALLLWSVPLSRSARGRRIGSVAVGLVFLLTLLTLLRNPVNASAGFGSERPRPAFVGIGVLVALAVWLLARRTRTSKLRAGRYAGAAVAGAVALALVLVQPSDASQRYATFQPDRYVKADHPARLYQWAQSVSHRRIVLQPFNEAEYIEGDRYEVAYGKYALLFAYPLYGKDNSNVVRPVAFFEGSEARRPKTCRAWWEALARLHATEVVFWNPGGARPVPVEETWTRRKRSSRKILSQQIGERPTASLALYHVESGGASPCR